MFTLIVVLVTIALVALIAITSIFFGGDQFTEGVASAKASRYMNEAAQISGAINIYVSDHNGRYPGTLQDLVPVYLKNIPEGDWAFSNNYITRTGLTADECLNVNEIAGYSTIPDCSDPALTPDIPCCQDTTT